MKELALHVIDIIENGLNAGATRIELSIKEDTKQNLLQIEIEDNGRGIPAELISRVMDPFYTTRTTRRVGLGLSLFREASKRCGGVFKIRSKEGEGTFVHATFQRDHLDLAPLGDMAKSLQGLILGNPEVDFSYIHQVDGKLFQFSTQALKQELDDLPINHPKVVQYIGDFIRDGLAELRQQGSIADNLNTTSQTEFKDEKEQLLTVIKSA
jgi:anti-sigma regulatory factor (Ser/Thr protein kinase)